MTNQINASEESVWYRKVITTVSTRQLDSSLRVTQLVTCDSLKMLTVYSCSLKYNMVAQSVM